MKKLGIGFLSVAICLILTLIGILAVNGTGFVLGAMGDFQPYDYDSKIAKEYDWIGPKKGEIIDSKNLVNTDGVSLSQIPKSNLLVLTVVDPTCGACRLTQEQFSYLNERLTEDGMDYLIVSFSPKVSPATLSTYVKLLNIPSRSFAWSSDLESVLPSLRTIAYPSHILIDSSGTVIKTFPGTNGDRRIRDRMVRQVVNEVTAERDRRNAEFK